ncbi:MFS transporter [Brevibacterium ravenspurgense]|uniref:MFS transporter n=1 Tax=Brevibacterium ravenspurgense TaxID=479117 RepID=UPI0003116504|nr:MFS transporter [Brevibacterium ravenspurgense]
MIVPAQEKSSSRLKLVTASACLAQIMVVLDTTIIAVAMPSAQADLGFDDSARQWMVTAYTLVFGSLLLLGGRISQRVGIRTAFLVGLTGFAAASVLGGFATSTAWLLAARALQGAFAALLAPTNLSLMNVAFPEEADRAKAFAIFGAVAGAGAAAGLLLGGVLTESLSWRWCLFISMPIALVAAAVAAPSLSVLPGPQSRDGARDLFGLMLGTASVFSFVFGLSRADGDSWDDPAVITLLATGVILLFLFLIREKRAPNPLLPLMIPGDPVRGASYLSIAGVGLAQMGASIYLTYYFQEQLGYSPTKTGLMFLPLILGLMGAAVLSMRFLVPRWGPALVYPLGALCQAAGFWMLGTLGPDSWFGEGMVLPLVVAGIGIGLVMAPAMSLATAGTTVAYSGVASATANTSQQLGASLGVAFLSTWASRHVADGMEARAAEITAEIGDRLRRANATPTSTEGQAIAEQLKQAAFSDEVIESYRSGFVVMGFLAFAVSVLTLLVMWRAQSGKEADRHALDV